MGTQQTLLAGGFKPDSPQQLYESPGSYTFVVPSGLNPANISAVYVGGGGGCYIHGGGGGGGALGYANNLSVSAGDNIPVFVGDCGAGAASNGGASGLQYGGNTYEAGGGQGGQRGGGSSYGGSGGSGGSNGANSNGGGNGGNGAYCPSSSSGGPWKGAGGGGSRTDSGGSGYGFGGGGGGVGLYGTGPTGSGGSGDTQNGQNNTDLTKIRGEGGSGGGNGSEAYSGRGFLTEDKGGGTGASALRYNSTNSPDSQNHSGGEYGGGGATDRGGLGVIRIIWSTTGSTRTFPTTNVGK